VGEEMRKLRSREEDEQEVDISPLIDVVFILLIFFMVSTTFVKDAQLDIDRFSA
jgi:biopolymer transport protein ExbD